MFDFDAFPVLQTGGLLLREIIPEDASAIFAIRGDYEVTRHNIGAAYTEIQEARELIDGMTRAYAERREIRWGVCVVDSDEAGPVIGMCGFNYWHQTDQRASIGFDLARAFWGQGIMGEALWEVIHFGFTEMHLNRIEADVSAENKRSGQLLERLNFFWEGTQREQYLNPESGDFVDLHLYARLRREWKTAP